jgi:hypothetical protein
MAVANGFGKVATSGLVFMYDTGDTINSYIGEPTTNYQWNGGSEVTPWTVGGINTDVTNTVNQGPIKGAKTWKFQKTGTSNQWNGWESSYGGIWSGNSGDIWTTSYWYKTNNDAGMGGFWIGAFYTPDWSRPYNTTVLANVSSIIPDGQWHYNYTVTRFNENYSSAIIVDGPSWGYSGQAGELYINGLQWEKKPHATPFAYGTRSATQGLLPLVGNSSIDLSNVSFTSNAQMTFDGTDDGIIINTSQFNKSNGDPITVECVIKPQRNAGQYQDLIVNRSNSLYNWMLYQHTNDGSIQLHGSDQYKSTYIPTLNQYVHIVATVDASGNYVLYANGEVKQTVSGWTYAGMSPSQLCIGIFGDARYEPYQGNIDIAKIYDRALSASEVKQNYNKYKTRFNLS